MTFSMKGRLASRPGWRITRRGWPNCSTKAISVWSTMNSELIMKTPATTSRIATTVRMRRFTIPSSLTPAQRRGGGRRRLPRTGRRRPGAGSRRVARWRCARCPLAVAEGGQRQIGKHAVPALRGFVDDHLVAVLEDLLHRLEVEPLHRDILRRLEGVVDRQETIGIALRASDDLLTIGFRLLLDRRGGTARPRDDVVAVGLCLVAQPFAVRKRALHVAEGVDDRRRRIDSQQLQLSDFNPGAIGIEDALQQVLRVG